ncbi:MAG TPA: formate dehydrogenase accessory sulfurtransferase FdhD [Sumerlaeia bacterium]|nr:formate dehydrogenase accessory sulfurtransferase FdhD [Sumerlaeia bacterium]
MTSSGPAVTSFPIQRVTVDETGRAAHEERLEQILVEEPLRILVNEREVAVLMRTPGQDLELAVGFVLTEGIVDDPRQIAGVRQCGRSFPAASAASTPSTASTRAPTLSSTEGGESGGAGGRVGGDAAGAEPANVVQLWTIDGVEPRLGAFREVRSSCSLCGAEEIERLLAPSVRPDGDAVGSDGLGGAASLCGEFWPPEDLVRLAGQLRPHQPLFHATGAAHGAAVFDRSGRLLVLAEDIGRHNALDKAVGALGWRGMLRPSGTAAPGASGTGALACSAADPSDPGTFALALSSRLSFEMVLKAWRAGIRNVVAVSAASSMAVAFARRAGVQIAAFARGSSMNLFPRR